MNKRLVFSAVAATLVCTIGTAPAYAQTLVSADDPAVILEIAKGFGSAELKRDDDGDPMITGRMAGILYSIFFYRCTDGKACQNIQFSAGWSGYKVSADRIRAWNRQALFGKAFLDEVGDPIVELAVNLNHGVTRENFDDTFDWWKVVLQDFASDVVQGAEEQGDGVQDVSTPI